MSYIKLFIVDASGLSETRELLQLKKSILIQIFIIAFQFWERSSGWIG